MIHKTRGIVFRFTKFRETSIIVTIFTELFGLQSYIVNGVRSSSSKSVKIALFQPLTLLELEAYHRETANIHRLKEIKCYYPYSTIPSNIKKSSQAIFVNEIINKVVKEESHAQEIFEFISQSLMTLDQQETGYENFHLIFMLKLSRFLGFGVHNIAEIPGSNILGKDVDKMLTQLIQLEYTTSFAIDNQQRRLLMEMLLKFYDEHIENFGEIRSVQVLREVLL